MILFTMSTFAYCLSELEFYYILGNRPKDTVTIIVCVNITFTDSSGCFDCVDTY